VTQTSTAKEKIAQRIVQLRRQHGVAQKQLAVAIGLDPSSMNRIEKGERAVSVGELIRIADFCGVSAESILREPESSGVLFRMGEHRGAAVEQSLEIFRGVIRDYFGARATVS
jgi:transcriptional regulator with XRE-family HTH domain